MKYMNIKRYKFSTISKNFNTLIAKNFKTLGNNVLRIFEPIVFKQYSLKKIYKYLDIRRYNFTKVTRYFDPRTYNINRLRKIKLILLYTLEKLYLLGSKIFKIAENLNIFKSLYFIYFAFFEFILI